MCLSACMFVYMYARYTQRPDEGSRCPITGVTSCCGCALWMLEVRSESPPKAASVLNHGVICPYVRGYENTELTSIYYVFCSSLSKGPVALLSLSS